MWGAGATETVTWNVANTTAAPISTANVNILLSTDGGETFNMLLENTPNDGTEAINIPTDITLSDDCRILIEAVGNVFFAVNSVPFSIDSENAAGDFNLEGFTLYPNPNNGSFTVSFTPESSEDVNVMVYDMRGRQIYGNSYSNIGVFSQDVNLDGIQSGIYLVSVQNGNRKEVKRIVIE